MEILFDETYLKRVICGKKIDQYDDDIELFIYLLIYREIGVQLITDICSLYFYI